MENFYIEIQKPQSEPFVAVNWYRPLNSPFNYLIRSSCSLADFTLKMSNFIKWEILIVLCIGNSMVSSAIWKKHARVSFSKTIKMHEFEGRVQFEVFEKLTSVCFFQIARETILLLVNNIHEKI